MSEPNSIIPLLALGLFAGVLSGMFGIGGGLVIVPALIVGFGFGTKEATGTSLFALMWPVGLLGVLEYWRRGELRIGPGLLIAVSMFVGAYFGAKITGGLSQAAMRRIYGLFLLVVGIYFLYSSRGGVTEAALAAADPPAAPRPIDPNRGAGPGPADPASQVQRPPDLSW